MSVAAERPYQFLQYQKNSWLERIRNHEYDPAWSQRPLLFQKPAEITQQPGMELPLFWRDKLQFAEEWRGQIARYIESFGVKLELIRDFDTREVKAFLHRRYPESIAKEICAVDLHRFRQYGHGLVLKAPGGEIKGTIFEIGYDTPEKTSYTVRLAVDEGLEGQNLGYHLMMYSALLAMEKGSRVKRGLIQFENTRSLYVNLNKVGWICDGFEPEITDLGAFFHICLPLDPPGLTRNAIEMDKLLDYLRRHRQDQDYVLTDTDDFEAVCELYSHSDFRIVAVIPPGLVHEKGRFVAMPVEKIFLDQRYRPYAEEAV